MLRIKFQCLFNRVFPDLIRQLGQAEDQIYADVPYSALAKDSEGFKGTRRVMAAVHPAEDSVVEGLDAHADPVHAKGKESMDIFMPFFHDVLRVHFYGELIERRCRDGLFDRPGDRG